MLSFLRQILHRLFPDRRAVRLLGDPTASLAGIDMRGLILSGRDLDGRDLSGADLTGVPLDGASLRGADLRGARLVYCNLREADLSAANLENADLRGADLRGAITDGARFGSPRRNLALLDARAFRGLGIPEDTPDWLLAAAGLRVRGRQLGLLGGPSPEALARLALLDRIRAGMLGSLYALSGRPGAAVDAWDRLDRLWHRLRQDGGSFDEFERELGHFEEAMDRALNGAKDARTVLAELRVTGELPGRCRNKDPN